MSDAFFIGGRQSDAGLTPAIVGNKAANLVRLGRLGLSIPPALALSVEVCRDYLTRDALPDGFLARLAGSIRQLEAATGLTMGHRCPLLLSVRSSPPISMPGMLETLLNIGLTEQAVHWLIRRTGNPWLAWDGYRRLVRSFAEAACGLALEPFDRLTAMYLSKTNAENLQELDPLSVRDLARDSADLLEELSGAPLPRDPMAQVVVAVEAVLRSWRSARARAYRRLNGIDDGSGTGVLIQVMVFGNADARSGSGVGFTRNPATGEDELYVDFLPNAQGEDVVSGRYATTDGTLLSQILPDVHGQLMAAKPVLEREFLDMQDFEFTVEEGRLFFLQTRAGKRTPWAAVRIATDLARAGILDPAAALQQLAPYDLDTIVRSAVRPRAGDVPLAHAIAAGIGVATGGIVFDAVRAQQLAADRPVILVRPEIVTDDIAGLSAAAGILTTLGGRTSHAAVVARQLGKPCLVGCADLHVEEATHACSIGGRLLHEGEVITLDGETGLVYAGHVPVVSERPADALDVIERWRRQ